LAELIGAGDEVLDHTEPGGRDIGQAADGIATAARQARVARSRDAKRIVIGRRHRLIVGDKEVARPVVVVARSDGYAVPKLPLDFGRDLPQVIADAPASEDVRVVPGGVRVRLTEVPVRNRS